MDVSWLDICEFKEIQGNFRRIFTGEIGKSYYYLKSDIIDFFMKYEHLGIPIFKDPIRRMERFTSNHGRLHFDRDKLMTIFEHTVDFLTGANSGTGLFVNFPNEDVNKCLVLAGLLHDYGKVENFSATHGDDSVFLATKTLSFVDDKYLKFIKSLILGKDVFHNKNKPLEDIIENVKETLSSIYRLPEMDEIEIYRALFSMFLADSTTLYSQVYSKIKDYCDDVFTRINSLSLEELPVIVDKFNPREKR